MIYQAALVGDDTSGSVECGGDVGHQEKGAWWWRGCSSC